MRLRIAHEIVARWDPPCTGAIRKLRMTPRTYESQYVGTWRIDVDQDCRLDRTQDAYGNVVHNFSLGGPLASLSILATGEVEVDDTAGVLHASVRERLPPGLYLRPTALAEPDEAIRALAGKIGGNAADPLDTCHRLKSLLHEFVDHRDAEAGACVGTDCRTAAAVLASASGDAVDVAHLFVATARVLGVPARVVTGYLFRGDRRDAGAADHAWAEAHVAGLGWVGFDAPNDRCPTDAYVRISASLDRLGASFLRGADHGGTVAGVTSQAMITQADI